MRHDLVLLALAISLGGIQTRSPAAPTWCAANHADAVFCEDWDRYCAAPPSNPTEACPPGSPRGPWSPMWQTGVAGCSSLTLEDFWVSSTPFSGRAPSSGDLGNSMISLGPAIKNSFGTAYTQIAGTDQHPLILQCVLDGPPGIDRMNGVNAYMELALGRWQNLTDFIWSDNCTSCGDTYGNSYPMICRQSPTPHTTVSTCPPISTAPVLPSIAVGAVAYLDSNPCHCGEAGDHFSHTHHLSVFDGTQWWTLNPSLIPGTFPGNGNFLLQARKTGNKNWTEPGPNLIRLTIKSTTMRVELTHVTAANPQASYSWCEIPRQYLGTFNVLNMGYVESCRLVSNSSQWQCASLRQCSDGTPAGPTESAFDNIAVLGGFGYSAPGACCITRLSNVPPTIECVQANGELDCITNHGGEFQGHGTACDDVPCCPPFWPDHDMDGDVDLEDFGWFQTCLSEHQFATLPSVACQCANLNGDWDVDAHDFSIFADCLSGPGVAADPNCM